MLTNRGKEGNNVAALWPVFIFKAQKRELILRRLRAVPLGARQRCERHDRGWYSPP